MNGIVLMVFQREMCKRSHPSLVPWVVCDPEVAMLGLGGGVFPDTNCSEWKMRAALVLEGKLSGHSRG